MLKSKPRKNFIDSAGTAAYQGIARSKINFSGLEIWDRSQITKTVILRDFKKFDRIYAMDEHNYQKIISLA